MTNVVRMWMYVKCNNNFDYYFKIYLCKYVKIITDVAFEAVHWCAFYIAAFNNLGKKHHDNNHENELFFSKNVLCSLQLFGKSTPLSKFLLEIFKVTFVRATRNSFFPI